MVIAELKAAIQTPEQLDTFLSDLLSSIHQYYNTQGTSVENYNSRDGHEMIKVLIHVMSPAFIESHSDEDLDWWYTLGRHMPGLGHFRLKIDEIYKKKCSRP